MNKEPIGLYIFRYLVGLCMLIFIGMLYWSSLEIEEKVGLLRNDLSLLKNDIYQLRNDINKIHDDILHTLIEENIRAAPPTGAPSNPKPQPLSKTLGRHIDNNLPNLLTEDPFYTTTLPKLLGEGFKPHGEFKTASLGRPDNLHPFSNWSQVSEWQNLCTVSVSELHFGKYEVYAPSMAVKVEERKIDNSDRTEFWIHLRDDVYWEPLKQEFFLDSAQLAPQFLRKHPVTAHDFKFYYDAMMNPHVQAAGAVAQRSYYNDLENIEVVDDLTFIVRWKEHPIINRDGQESQRILYLAKSLTFTLRPLPLFVYGYFADGSKIIEDDQDKNVYRNNSAWAQNFADHWARNIIVSCGPWIFDGMTEREIRFKRNSHYFAPLAALGEVITNEFKTTTEAIWQDFKLNHLDYYALQPDQVADLQDFLQSKLYREQEIKQNDIKRLDYLARVFNYIGWNETKPFFSRKQVRQALTMAIDRQRIIQQNLNGLGIEITSPFYRYSTSYDPNIQPWPFDMQRARQLLEEEGWYDSDGDGIIDKVIDGKSIPFSFALTYYVKNEIAKSICEYISTSLKELGIDCRLRGADIADLSAIFDDKAFDAICFGWALGTPPEDPRQIWHSSGSKEKGSSNAIGFSNQEIDNIIHLLDYEYEEAERQKLYYRFAAIIHEEAPYTFLYSPKIAFLYRQHLQNVFIPADRQDLIPGATVSQPDRNAFWLKKRAS